MKITYFYHQSNLFPKRSLVCGHIHLTESKMNIFPTIHTLVSNKQQRTQFSCRTDKQASQSVSELEKKGVTTGTANVSL